MDIARRYLQALNYWSENKHTEALKEALDYENMRHKPKFEKAKIKLMEYRKELGLPMDY